MGGGEVKAFPYNVNHTVACGVYLPTQKQIDLKFKCFNNIRGGGGQMLTNEELIGFEGWDAWVIGVRLCGLEGN